MSWSATLNENSLNMSRTLIICSSCSSAGTWRFVCGSQANAQSLQVEASSSLAAHPTTPASHVLPLNRVRDCPDGLPSDVWQNLVQARDRKMASEVEVAAALHQLNNLQTRVFAVLATSDKISADLASADAELAALTDARFQSLHNTEHIFHLNLGQVSAIVVTYFL